MSLLATLADRGLRLSRNGVNIDVEPAEKITPELRALILANKPALLVALSRIEDAGARPPAKQPVLSPEHRDWVDAYEREEAKMAAERETRVALKRAARRPCNG